MASLLAWAVVSLVCYYVLVELPSPTFDVHTKGCVVVSGASSGIGLDSAIDLASKGFTTFAGVRKEADGASVLAECVRQHNAQVCENLVPVILDVTKAETIESTHALVQAWTIKTGLPLVAVVNNAGVTHQGPAESLPMEVFRDVMEVNFFGMIALTKAFLPMVREAKGRIINISSLMGVLTTGSRSVYAGSKYAMEGFSDSLRRELRALGVSVSLVNPGYVVTKIGDKHLERSRKNKPEQKWLDLYGRYFEKDEERVKQTHGRGSSTKVTSDAIADAILSPRPQSRYYVANFGPIPALFIAFFARVAPPYLQDIVIEAMTAK